MVKIAVAGLVTPRGLGDALQYYVLVRLLNNLLPEDDITLICPDLKNGLFVFKDLKLKGNLLDFYPAGYGAFQRLLRSLFLHNHVFRNKQNVVKAKRQANKDNAILSVIRVVNETYEKYFSSYIIDKYLSASIMRPLQFRGCIFGGHTICGNIYSYIVEYETLHSVVNGPIVASPLSVSRLEYFERKIKRTVVLKRLKHALQKFDFVYTRGPFSLRLLRDYVGVDEKKLGMALDGGFGLRLIYKAKASEGNNRRIVIIPRKRYFYAYNKVGLYPYYLKALADLFFGFRRILMAR